MYENELGPGDLCNLAASPAVLRPRMETGVTTTNDEPTTSASDWGLPDEMTALHGYIRRIAGPRSAADVEDLLQEILERALRYQVGIVLHVDTAKNHELLPEVGD